MMTDGFYKNEDNNLLYGPNFVLNEHYELHAETDSTMTEPVDGWMWYESEEAARAGLGIMDEPPATEPEVVTDEPPTEPEVVPEEAV